MKKIRIQLIALLFIASLSYESAAQERKDIRPIQVSLFTPIGTNEFVSSKTMNHFSLNMLWGSSAGVFGAEIGGLANFTNGPVKGFQVGGLGNINQGDVVGVQVGGLINTSRNVYGVQIGGIANISTSEKDTLEKSKGNQVGGIVNYNENDFNGLQLAGIVNVQRECIRGVQMAGILNKAEKVRGVQIGFINVADTFESGIPIGFINIIKNGYYAVELETNESFYANVHYKMGINRFYNIFSIGFEEQNGKSYWAPGFGFGTQFPLGRKTGLAIEALSYQLNEDEWWTDLLNSINKLKVTGSYQVAPSLALVGGLSMNVKVTDIKDDDGNEFVSDFKIPDSFYDESHGNTRVTIYPGFHAGLRF